MELAVEKLIHNETSNIGDVTDKLKQLKGLFPNYDKEKLLSVLYDMKGDLSAATKCIMEDNNKIIENDSVKSNNDKIIKDNSIKDNESIYDEKVNKDSNTTSEVKDNNAEKSTLSKSESHEVEITNESNKISSKNYSNKMDKKNPKSYSNSGRNKSKSTPYNDYYKHYYGGGYRSFSKKSDFKKKSYYDKEKESKSNKHKKSFDENNELIKERKAINNDVGSETLSKVDTINHGLMVNEPEDKLKKLSWAQVAKPKIDNNRECKVIIEKKSTTEHVIRKEIKSSKENSNETISIKITIKESGNGDKHTSNTNEEIKDAKANIEEEKVIENMKNKENEIMVKDVLCEDIKGNEIESKENENNNENNNNNNNNGSNNIMEGESISTLSTENDVDIINEKIDHFDPSIHNDDPKLDVIPKEGESSDENTEISAETIQNDVLITEEKESLSEDMVEKDLMDMNHENIVVFDNKSKIDELNEKIAKQMSQKIKKIYETQKIHDTKIKKEEKTPETNKNTFIQSNIKNKISLSDISKVDLHFGSLYCSGKNVENRTYFIDNGNTLYQNMNELVSNEALNNNVDLKDHYSNENNNNIESTADLLSLSDNKNESSTEVSKASSETTSLNSSSAKVEGSVPPYRHPFAGQTYNPVFHQNNYKNSYNRRNNYRENNSHYREGSNTFNNNNNNNNNSNNRNSGFSYHKSNKYNNDFNYNKNNYYNGHNNFINNKYNYRNNNSNNSNKYPYYNGNKNNHISYFTPFKFINPVNINMNGKPIAAAPAAIPASPIVIGNADMGGIAAYHVSSSVMNLYNNQNAATATYPLNISNKDGSHFASIPNTGNICYTTANPPYMKVFYVASSQYANTVPFNSKYQGMKTYNPSNKHYYLKSKFNNHNNNYNNNNNGNNNNNNNNNDNNSNNNSNHDNSNNESNNNTSNNNIKNNENNNNDNNNNNSNSEVNLNNKNNDSSDKNNEVNYIRQDSLYKTYSSDETITNDTLTASSNHNNSSAYNSENK